MSVSAPIAATISKSRTMTGCAWDVGPAASITVPARPRNRANPRGRTGSPRLVISGASSRRLARRGSRRMRSPGLLTAIGCVSTIRYLGADRATGIVTEIQIDRVTRVYGSGQKTVNALGPISIELDAGKVTA